MPRRLRVTAAAVFVPASRRGTALRRWRKAAGGHPCPPSGRFATAACGPPGRRPGRIDRLVHRSVACPRTARTTTAARQQQQQQKPQQRPVHAVVERYPQHYAERHGIAGGTPKMRDGHLPPRKQEVPSSVAANSASTIRHKLATAPGGRQQRPPGTGPETASGPSRLPREAFAPRSSA